MKAKIAGVARSFLDVRTYAQAFRLLHFASYAHVQQVRRLRRGANVTFARNVSFRNAERITLGAGTHIGEFSIVWAGNSTGRITLGEKCLLAPHVTLTASNYATEPGAFIMDQPKVERDIVIGRDVWLGANTVVLAGVTIGAIHPWRVERVDYPHALVRLNFCKVYEWSGALHMHEGQECAWQQLPVTVRPVLPGTVPVLKWFAEERGFAGATH